MVIKGCSCNTFQNKGIQIELTVFSVEISLLSFLTTTDPKEKVLSIFIVVLVSVLSCLCVPIVGLVRKHVPYVVYHPIELAGCR